MTTDKDCPTQYLDEDTEPLLLEPQLRAARSLQHLIESSPGGRVVSLEGRFGSGKTTIVRHLREHYDREQPRQTYVLVFDAWAHRGEALRRAFVTKVEQLLVGRNLLTTDEGHSAEQAMTRMPDVALAKMRPQFPLIAGLLGGITITFTVARVLSTFGGGRPTADIDSLLAFVLGALLIVGGWFLGRTTTETVTHKGADLTSMEFEGAFVKAVSTALRKKEKLRLVFVLDDLDRLRREDVDEIVTLLRIFFQAKGQIAGVDRLWFVVPFDRQQMSRNLDVGGAEDAIQKLFSRRIDVPPPNLPASASVFHERFSRAFPKHTALEASEIHSMLLLREGAVTLRRVHWFLNRIAGLHATWCGQIPLTDIAAYALIRDAMADDKYEEQPRPGGAVDEKVWRTHFATLYFNVSPEQTVYVVLANDIEAAMLSGNGERLHMLADTVGFENVVLQIVTRKSEQLSKTPDQLMNAAKALALVLTNDKLAPVWQSLIQTALRVPAWTAGADLRGLALLLLQANSGERRTLGTAALTSLSNGLQLSSTSPQTEIDHWFDNFNRVVETLGADAPLDALDQISGSPRFRLEILRAIAEGRFRHPRTPPIYVGDDSELRKFILDLAASDSFDRNRDPLAEMIQLGAQWDWSETLERGEQMMATASVIKSGHPAMARIIELFAMIERLAQRPEATQKLDSYAEFGGFLHFMIYAWGTEGPTVPMMLACLALRPLERVGNKVYVVSEREILRTNAEKVLGFLRSPSGILSIGVGDALHRLGLNVVPQERLPQIAEKLDASGGIEFVGAIPAHNESEH